MSKQIYSMIIFFVLTFIFIYVNFFYLNSKLLLINNTSKCLLSYKAEYIDIKCATFNDFYNFYSENSNYLRYTKIKHYSLDNKLKYQVFK